VGDWIGGVGDVVGHDPSQAEDKANNHKDGKPLWALGRQLVGG